MGLPAGKLGAIGRGAGRERTPHLRLIPAPKRPLQAASGPAEAACKSAFQLALVALVALTVLGLVRVTLSAKTAEASIDQVRLESSIKAESRVADRLELDRSMLVTPSRIESLAAGLQMTKAPAVRYIAVPEPAAPVPETEARDETLSSRSSEPPAAPTLAGVLGAALEVTEKEARTLLVGDVGVAASR